MTARDAPGDPITEATLNSYIDGELAPARRIEVETYLAQNPDAARFVEEASALTRRLQRACAAGLTAPPAPEHRELGRQLDAALASHASSRRPAWWHGRRPALAAAVVAMLLASGALLWRQADQVPVNERLFALFSTNSEPAGNGRSKADTALKVDDGPATAEQAVAVIDDGQAAAGTATPAAKRASSKEDGPSQAPDLSRFGFSLISTRVLAKPESRSMQLIYQSSEGARVELFYSPNGGGREASLTLMEAGHVAVMFWSHDQQSYTLVGEVGRDTLLEMGKVINGEWTIDLPGQAGTAKAPDDGGGTTQDDAGSDASPRKQGGGGSAPEPRQPDVESAPASDGAAPAEGQGQQET